MNNKNFIATTLVFLSLFIIVLFTSSQITKMTELNNVISETEGKKEELLQENKKLQDIKNKLDETSKEYDSEVAINVGKFSKDLKENEVLDFIYSEINTLNGGLNPLIKKAPIVINNLRFSNSQLNLMSFKEVNINIDLKVPTESRLRDVLNLLNDNDKYKFFITSLDYKDDLEKEQSDGFSVSIPLKVFYK